MLAADTPRTVEDLKGLSIDDLANLQVTSVSKHSEALSDAPAAIYVITREEILRSGAQTIPEMLRLAPNLQVYQTGSSGYVVTARGLNGNNADQSFSNKLLVLVDGRTVYTPLFSGVYWDLQQVLPEDIDRIEVISGPGATLWASTPSTASSISLPAGPRRQPAGSPRSPPAISRRPLACSTAQRSERRRPSGIYASTSGSATAARRRDNRPAITGPSRRVGSASTGHPRPGMT